MDKKQLHKHHIIPKHMGGTNHSSNLVLLTVEEHTEAHRLLWEKYGHWQDEIAYKGLAGIINKEEAVRRACGHAKGKKRDPEVTARIVAKQKGQKRSEETKLKMRMAKRSTENVGKYVRTDEHKLKMSLAKRKVKILE
jgi:hypothetical protein